MWLGFFQPHFFKDKEKVRQLADFF